MAQVLPALDLPVLRGSMAGLIGNTDASGHVGGKVAALLAARGHRQRLIVPDAAAGPDLPGAEISVLADESDSEAMQAALAGVDTVFLVPVRERPDRVPVHRGAVDAAVAAGVGHIVYLSFLSAAPDATFTWARDHYATEEYIRAAGASFTVLRGSVFLEVLQYAVGPDQTIRSPGGDGRFAPVARDDMARVVAAVLESPGSHAGQTYDITGPATISFRELAEAFTARGTPVSYADQDVTEALALARASGMPEWQAQGWVSALHQIPKGELDLVSDTVRTLTGRQAVSLAEFLGRHP
jgi:NAD(P)H dehydrogenase (quinone)